MIIRILLRALRWTLIAFMAALVLFCILFALIQSTWAKEKIRTQLLSLLEKKGIRATLVEIDGQPPFTWTIRKAVFDLGDGRSLELSGIKLRIAVLPLLRGTFAINYLNVQRAVYAYSFAPPKENAENDLLSTLENGRALLGEQLKTLSFPFHILIHHFTVDQAILVNLKTGSTETVNISGKAKVRKDKTDFFLDLQVTDPSLSRTHFKALAHGSQAKNRIGGNLVLRLDAFRFPEIEGNLSLELSLEGPWTTWSELLYDLPVTDAPLRGSSKGMIAHTRIPAAPLLNRAWRFKTQFSLPTLDEVHFQNLMLLSDLFHVKGKAELFRAWEKSKGVFAFSSPDLSRFSPFTPVNLFGTMKGKGYFHEGSFKSSFETHGFKIDSFPVNTLKGIVKGSVEAGEWETEVRLSSADAALPFESSLALEYAPGRTLSLIDLHLQGESVSLSGYTTCNLTERLADGSFFATIAHLDAFAPYVHEETLSGKAALELNLSSREREQDARLAIVGENLRYQDYLVDDLTMSADVRDLYEEPQGKLSLLAQKVYTPGFYLERLNFGTRSDEVHWPFFVDAAGRIDNPFQFYASGFWQNEKTLFTLELTKLFGDLSTTPFSLHYPASLEWGADYLNVSPFDFRIGEGSLTATCEMNPVRTLLQWDVKHFPLEVLSCLRPRFGLSGLASASGYIDASSGAIEGALSASLKEADVLHFGKKEPLRAKGSLQAHLSDHHAQVHTHLQASDGQLLDFAATLPIDYTLYPFTLSVNEKKNTAAELIAEGKLQDLFDFVNLGTNHFTGLLSCRLFLSQSLSNPSLRGELQLQNGSYENYFTGINLRNIDARFEAQNDEIRLLKMTATDESTGTVEGTGKISLQPENHFPYSLDAEMKKLHAVGFDMIDCDLTGPLYLTGDFQKMFAQGNLLIDEAKIEITERLPYEVPSLPVSYVNRPPHLISKTLGAGPDFEFHLDLEVTSEGNVIVEGSGLNAELEGNVHLYGTNTNILANGSLKLIKGEYLFSGKVFKLTEGEIIFNDKPTPSAYLNLNGTLTLPDMTITAMLRGPLTSPQLTFQSNPQKPTSSILALILFNKDISDISHPEAIQLANTLMSISGGAGPDVLETIRKSIGVDRLNISSRPGTDEIAVQIGKYLTRGILITLSQSATSSQVIVEVELPKGFIFQAETQEQEEGKFSLKWRKSY